MGTSLLLLEINKSLISKMYLVHNVELAPCACVRVCVRVYAKTMQHTHNDGTVMTTQKRLNYYYNDMMIIIIL